MSETVKPPLDRYITVPELLQFHAEHNPTRPLFVLGAESEDDVTEITYLEYIRSCHRVAHLVRPNRSGPDEAVVGLIGLLDNHVYQTIHLGIIQAGLVPMLISPRLTPVAVLNLLRVAGAHRLLITGHTLHELLQGIKDLAASSEPPYELSIEEVPAFHQIYPKHGTEKAEDPFEPYPWVSSFPAQNKTALYLHSSGSTGLPKAVPISHGNMLYTFHPCVGSYAKYKVPLRLGGMALPPFHLLAWTAHILVGLYAGAAVTLFPATVLTPDSVPVMATPEAALKCCKATRTNALACVPAMLQFYAQNPDHVRYLATLESVIFAGGPLAPATGDYLVASGVRLRAIYGSTEGGLPAYLDLEGKDGFEDWEWMNFGTDKPYIRWNPMGDGTSELHILCTDTYKPSLENLEDVPGYATSDLFTRHPTNPGLWKITGRADDVIIHSSGEKTVPLPMEHVVIQSPLIQGAVMFGRQRDQPGFLIEPTPENQIDVTNETEVSEFRNKIWPVIEQANDIAPAFSRVYKEMILITTASKPLPRAAKGTVMRKAAYKEYEKEIDQIYETVEANGGGGSVAPPSAWTSESLQEWILTQVQELTGHTPSISQDLFEKGLDSLSATILRLRIVSALRNSGDASVKAASQLINQNAIYTHPSIESLAQFVVGIIFNAGDVDESHEVVIERMIEQYSKDLDIAIQSVPNGTSSQGAQVVLLTGSTGNLGSQVLASLLEKDSVARVYTINRPSTKISTLDRHKERFQDKELDIDLLSSKKLTLLEGDTSQPHLGLSDEDYNELQRNITVIIHNAWRLDFNLGLSSFEPQIRGVRNLVDLARSSQHVSSLRFLFTSSIAAASSWTSLLGPCPEHIEPDPKFAVGSGYGESKYVSERILEKSGLHVSILRIGQISGGKPNGAWAISDWFPMMVKSSLPLGFLPEAHGVVSWAPMDAISEAISDVAFTTENLPLVVNLVHPYPVAWKSMIEAVRKAIIAAKGLDSGALPLLPLQEWANLLQKHSTGEKISVTELPASKILEFIQRQAQGDEIVSKAGNSSLEAAGLASFVTTNACRISARMRNLAPFDSSDAELWVQYWMQKGL
ncbi:hypothetical protein GYMLUDRAFT_40242 [Collybiopsis luxurians FD-317 M1]|uniref:Polyketide synthase-like phosphopantetheine-binding domain-containing protein n=1 Tax=Collybiopsis luxurians FD-317 M1 TaxID=944289 RepID=A0A0D0BIV0_9AGAR|nr:hypothetical protein GYMLUDRAFT_40242 [Collybiopsis luxurians FD-317 M1]